MKFQSNADSALRKFVESRDEAIFTKLITEHGGLVFASALRRTRDHELAEEITQSVFAILAHKAESVLRHPSLMGWLFTTTKFEAAKAMRSRSRHQKKLVALTENAVDSTPETSNELLPHLDDLLDRLPKQDRELLIARFFKEASFRELARQTGKTEAACKMRIKRTLEKLRASLTARGATVSVTTLSLTLSAEFSRALPVSLAASLPSQALASAASMKTGSVAFTHFLHSMNTLKTSTVAAAFILIATVPIILQHRAANDLRHELTTLRGKNSSLSERQTSSSRSSRSEKMTPIARLLSQASVPATGEEFLGSFFKAQSEGNMAAVLKIFLPLSRAGEEKIQSLITEVETSKKFPMIKGNALKMLFEFGGATGKNPGDVIEQIIDGGVSLQNLGGKMSEWFEKDPDAALAWFRVKLETGELVGEGVRHSPEASLAMDLIPKLLKKDREAALALVDQVDPLNRGKVIEKLAPILTREGKESWPKVQKLIESLTDIDERMRATGSAVTWVGIRNRDEVRGFLNGMELSEIEISQALAEVASVNVHERPESISARMAWLKETATSSELGEAVKRATESLARYKSDEVKTWLDSTVQSPVRESALAGFATALIRERKYEEAFERVGMISDSERQKTVRESLLKKLETQNPEAARRFVLPINPN